MTVKVKMIQVDGYAGWGPVRVYDITLPKFTPQDVTDYIFRDQDPGYCKPSELCHEGKPIVKNGTISLIGEENGFIAVLIG